MRRNTWTPRAATFGAALGLLCVPYTASPAPFVQTNLVSVIAGLATITDSSLVNPWGGLAYRHEPLLDLGSRDKSNQPLVGDRPYDCDQDDGRQPADRQYRDPARWDGRSRTHRSSEQSKPQPLELSRGNGRERRFRALHLCEPERHDLRLGHRRHSLYPSNDSRRQLQRPRHQPGSDSIVRRQPSWDR